jgi:hypothetical protein
MRRRHEERAGKSACATILYYNPRQWEAQPMLRFTLAIAFVFGLIAPALAQNSCPPDFPGTWILNLAKSKLEEHSFIVSSTLVISCSGRTVEIDDTMNGQKQQPWIYTTDGKQHLFALLPGGEEVAKANWKKSVLVTRLIGRKTKPPFDFTDRWTVSADGRTLTQESRGRLEQTFVYDKQ